MLNSNYIQTLLGIKDAIVTNVENSPNHSLIDVHFELKRNIHECPNCKELTDSIHDYRIQKIKGPPLGEKFILFHYRKRRYICPACEKRFYENNSFVPKYHRMTSSLVSYILKELKSTASRSSVAAKGNVSVYTVARIFDFISPGKPKLPEVLAIDEFKGNAETGKYQCILTDPKNRKVLDILPGREVHHLSSYFFSFPREERAKVKVIVIDISPMQIWLKLISEMLLLLLIVFIIFAKYCGPLIRYVVTSNISFPESVGVILKGAKSSSGQDFLD